MFMTVRTFITFNNRSFGHTSVRLLDQFGHPCGAGSKPKTTGVRVLRLGVHVCFFVGPEHVQEALHIV